MTYKDRRRHDHSDSEIFKDYEGRLHDSFYNYVERREDYDQNMVPWPDEGKIGKPVLVQMSAYLRKVYNAIISITIIISRLRLITNRNLTKTL